VPIAMHYGEPSPRTAIREEICDCFVLEGGVTRVMRSASVASETRMGFWLQLVGTGITAAFSLHLAAVFKGELWPSVNCHQVYRCDLLKDSIVVSGGAAAVPEKPGIGHEPDEQMIARLRIAPRFEKPQGPRRLITTTWPTGGKSYFTHGAQMADYFGDYSSEEKRLLPIFARGTTTGMVFDDGSAEFAARHAEAGKHPVHEPPLA